MALLEHTRLGITMRRLVHPPYFHQCWGPGWYCKSLLRYQRYIICIGRNCIAQSWMGLESTSIYHVDLDALWGTENVFRCYERVDKSSIYFCDVNDSLWSEWFALFQPQHWIVLCGYPRWQSLSMAVFFVLVVEIILLKPVYRFENLEDTIP